jgi:hypothetical protein
LARARELADGGSTLGAIDLLQDENRSVRARELDEALVALRLAAFEELDRTTAESAWPPEGPDLDPDLIGIPAVTPEELTKERLASGIVHHGALRVNGLASQDQVVLLRDDIDRAIEGHDAWREGAGPEAHSPWFVPFVPDGDNAARADARFARQWVRSGGGAWLVDSPRAVFDVLQVFDDVGLRRVLTEYLGERPAFSVSKSTLRRVPLDLTGADWHQDGAFLGKGIRTINVWLALTDCGVDAPGLDVVPRRINEILETGTRGAWFDWSVGQEIVDEVSADAPVVRPTFTAGDALLFDEHNLHRTALSPSMTHERYAIESWFFAPSCYPADQVPIVY